eukprot:TRINITY_DN1142_c0_g1_i1.p1 TRINITY_DN1142_c0_g1~~TRINITY_DN1142_c0_g1_i1.p1  ORF type:complete len:462 (-),score=135.31 TRINITY_DN1142_c0_g1_i1:101-1486(-)
MAERMSLTRLEDQQLLLAGDKKPAKKEALDAKLVSFFVIAVLTLLYVVAELGTAVYLGSLVLLSDGFHNLSDVVSLYIAYWARKATKRTSSDEMSYGWARTEILGGLTNGCFLLSLVLYVMLEAVPRFIKPEQNIIKDEMMFIYVSATGLGINLIGTIVFAITGNEHGHSHSHGGGGHSHGHGGHGHSHKDKDKKKKKKEAGTLELSENGSSPKEKKEKHGHAHGHDHKEKEKKSGGHGHDHGHKEKEKKGDHGHDHGHKEEKGKRDENVHAVFLHFLGDAISSLMVLGTGILLHFFPYNPMTHKNLWALYLDPASSLVIGVFILWTTIPLVKRCSMILLQHTGSVKTKKIKKKLLKVEGLLSLHDFHVWQLVDGMTIASVHIAIEEGVDFTNLITEVKNIFHKFGIHSTSIQPEFVPRNHATGAFCGQNCVKECQEDWCCKKSADHTKKVQEEFSIHTEL